MLGDFDRIVSTVENGYRVDAGTALVAWLRAVQPSDVSDAYDDLALTWARLDPETKFTLVVHALDVLSGASGQAVTLKFAQLRTLLE